MYIITNLMINIFLKVHVIKSYQNYREYILAVHSIEIMTSKLITNTE